MRHHHVAIGAGGLVEGRATSEPERLRHIDLYVIDEVAVPDRLEKAIGETERQDVLRRLLAQKMIDAENLFFLEYLVQLGIERDRALQIRAEGLFHDDARPLDQSRISQQPDCRQRGIGRHAQVVQTTALSAERLLRLFNRGLKCRGAGAQGNVVQTFGEVRPGGIGEFAAGEIIQCLARQFAEPLGVEVIQ